MMTETEHLLATLAEECDEVGKRCMKALRFGIDDRDPTRVDPPTERERLAQELDDLTAVADILRDLGVIRERSELGMSAKRIKVKQFMEYARARGTLER